MGVGNPAPRSLEVRQSVCYICEMTTEADQSRQDVDAFVQRQSVAMLLTIEYSVNPEEVYAETQRRMSDTENEFLRSICDERAKTVSKYHGKKAAGNYLLGNRFVFAYFDRLAQKTGDVLPVVNQEDVDRVDEKVYESEREGEKVRKIFGRRAEKDYSVNAFRRSMDEFAPVLRQALKQRSTIAVRSGQSNKDMAYFYAGAILVNSLLTRPPIISTSS